MDTIKNILEWLKENSGLVGILVSIFLAILIPLIQYFYKKTKSNSQGDSPPQHTSVMPDNKGNININYASETAFTESLRGARENLLEALPIETDADKKERISSDIQVTDEWLSNPTATYENWVKERNKLLQQLAVLQNEVEGREEPFIQAQEALKKGDLATADKIFKDITNDKIPDQQVKVLADAYYSRGTIDAQETRWHEAAKYFQKAAELNPSIEYLLKASFYLSKVAQYSEAERCSRQALKKSLSEHGENHSDTATSYNNVASNLDSQGKYSEAEPLYKKALEISQRVLGEDHPDTASGYNNAASNLQAQGKYSEAEPLYQKALKIWQRVLGEDHMSTATSYNNVASNLDSQGAYGEAEPLYQKALKIRQRVLGEHHSDTASSYNNIATNLKAQGKYSGAQPLHQKALEIHRRVLGEDHPDTATSYNNFAANLNAQGKYSEAESLLQKALKIRRRVLGEEHPDTASSYNNFAANLNAQGKYSEAEPYYKKALEISRSTLGEEHPNTQHLKKNYKIFLSQRPPSSSTE